MSGWFDKYAKKSAPSAPQDVIASRGPSRRRVIVGGSAAVATTAAAWTAPMLMASSAATIGLSACPSNAQNIIICRDGSRKCCPNSTDSCDTSTGTCLVAGGAGGFCGNCGQGTCPDAFKCNGNPGQSNNAEATNICGGEGAQCCLRNAAVGGCFGTTANPLTCVAQGDTGAAFCRKPCSATDPCRTTGVAAGNANCPLEPSGGQVCQDGFCAEQCARDSDCTGNAVCAPRPVGGGARVCTFNTDANLSAICAAAPVPAP